MRVVVLGGGYAGISVARTLEQRLPDGVEIVLVDESPHHLIRHEVHRVLRRPELTNDLQIPFDDLLERTTIVTDRVTETDRDTRHIGLADGETIEYDYAVICLGAETNFHNADLKRYGLPLRNVEHARRVRETVLDRLDTGGQIVIGGAGLSGIQVAGELAALIEEESASDAFDISLLEMEEAIAPGFKPAFQRVIREELESRDINVQTAITIDGATSDDLLTSDGTVSYDELVWTGGIRGPSALSGDRVTVRGDLRLGDYTFALGDAATVVDRYGEIVPATAQAAIRAADTASLNIEKLVRHDFTSDSFEPRLETFSFSPKAWVVSIGDGAVATVGQSILRDRAALAVKYTAGIGHLTSIGATRRAMKRVSEVVSR